MNAIEIKNLTRIYTSNKEKISGLNNISKSFICGKFYLIVGHSGSGKSTLLRLLGLVDKPTSGEIMIFDKNIKDLNNKELSKLRNRKIGFIFQDYFLDKYLTAKENVTIPMIISKKYKNKNEINLKSLELLKDMGLEKRFKHFPRQLSGGEQQRVSIARALANDPTIILADEPTGNLDVENEKYIFQKLKEMSQKGKCVIMVSHSVDAKFYADEILEIKEGSLL